MSGLENQLKQAMNAVLDHLKAELKGLRTGRANAAVLDRVTVEVYGSQVRLKEVGTVNVPDSRQIVVTPYDVSNLQAIAKGIEAANLNLSPKVDGKVVRIPVPQMDEVTRKQMAKLAKDFCEKTKVAFRDVRRKFNDLVKKQKTDGEISEDMVKRLEKMIQDFTDRYCKDADAALAEKEKEIMTV